MAGKGKEFTPAEQERLIQFYQTAENEILALLNRALLRGNQTDYLESMRDNVQKIISQLQEGNKTWCSEAIPRTYVRGVEMANELVHESGQPLKTIGGFGDIHQQAAQLLAENTYQRLNEVTTVIGRQVDDIYRELALERTRGSIIGYETWDRVARRYRSQLAEKGVTGFKDRSGKNWNMTTYTRMVARTTTMEAHLEGTKNRLMELDWDLVRVSSHHGACPLCTPWEGEILSLSGKTEGYPTLDEAKDAGLFHPNCRHAYGLHIDLDKEIEEMGEEEEMAEEELYNDSLLKESKASVFEKMLKEYSAEYDEKITNEDFKAIEEYQSISYLDMNGFLRGRYSDIDDYLRRQLENLRRAIKKVKIKENMLVARGTTTSAIEGDWNNVQIDDIIKDEGFMSTGLREETAIYFANRKEERGILMYIKIPKGTNGIMVDVAVNDDWESELLLAPGTKIRITGKRIENDMKIIEGVVVNE